MDPEYGQAYATLYRQHWWWRARERVIVDEVRRLLPADGSARILDVGCGAGLLFDALSPYGHVEGVESDASIASQAGVHASRIFVGQLDRFRSGHRYDLIVMADVIEHVERPEFDLRKAASLLSARGSVLITVPAFPWLWTLHDEINQHYTRYSMTQLTALVEQAGMSPRRSRYLFGWLVLPKLAVRIRERLGRPQPEVPGLPPAWLNRLLLGVSSTEARWLGDRLPCGSSLLMICGCPEGGA